MAISKFYNLDLDSTLSSNSDEYVSSQKAVKSYVDNAIRTIPTDLTWHLYTYQVKAESKTLTVVLPYVCSDVNGLISLYKGKINLPTDMVSLANDKKTVTITSDDYFTEGDYIDFKWANTTVNGNVDLVVASNYNTTTGAWYIEFASGLLFQGGVQQGTSVYGTTTITLPYQFNDVNYELNTSIVQSYDANIFTDTTSTLSPAKISDLQGLTCDKTISSFKIQSYSTHTWFAAGLKKQ